MANAQRLVCGGSGWPLYHLQHIHVHVCTTFDVAVTSTCQLNANTRIMISQDISVLYTQHEGDSHALQREREYTTIDTLTESAMSEDELVCLSHSR